MLHNDVTEVTRILSRFPGSIAELNIYGESPFHLAAANSRILAFLVKAAGISLLNQSDRAGITVLEAAMVLSSTQCVNGENSDRCRQCACTQCVNILLEAGCNARMHKIEGDESSIGLNAIFRSASELARRRYVFHMKELRTPRLRRPSLHYDPQTKRTVDGEDTTCGTSRAEPGVSEPLEELQAHVEKNEAEGWGWIYNEFDDPHFGELFYRHGFRPHPSFFIPPRWKRTNYDIMNISYTCWMVQHGVDLYLRSSAGPPVVEKSPNIGLFGAHYAFYLSGPRVSSIGMQWKSSKSLVAFNELSAAVERRNLMDSCQCHCSTRGCSPFIWMMKGMRMCWGPDPDLCAKYMVFYYSGCGPDLTILTHAAAIRYMTFQALGLTHTCCNADSLARDMERWVESDDVGIINEEQASLLELHEELVAEFENKALLFIKDEPDGRPHFPEFWSSHWIVRIKEVLEKLDGQELTDAERRGAEEIRVQWCEPVEKKVEKNPYAWHTLEHYFYELDLICPEYKEPWPDELRRVTELP